MKVNLHTHTARCGHASGTDEAYVLAAIEAGYTKLGFSDHTPFPYENGYVNRTKMLPDQLEGYIDSVLSLKQKYAERIEILLGLECEAVPRFFPYLQELRDRMDFLILGNHGDWSIGEIYYGRATQKWQLHKYIGSTVEAMESGLFLYLAHPDLMLCSYPEFDDTAEYLSRELCQEANRLRIPLEYNLYGIIKGTTKPGKLGYPCQRFWEIAAEENVRTVIGVDAHDPKHFLETDIDAVREKLESMGLTVLHDPTAYNPTESRESK